MANSLMVGVDFAGIAEAIGAVIGTPVVLIAGYRMFKTLHRDHHERRQIEGQTRMLAVQMSQSEADAQNRRFVELQSLTHQQKIEADKIALERERMYIAAQIELRRVLVPVDHTVVFTEADGSYTPIASPKTIAPPKKAVEEVQDTLPPITVPTGRELLLSGKVEEALREGHIILGMTADGQLAKLKIKRCFSTLVSGLPSVGKSTTVFWITGQLTIIGAKLWVIDPHMDFQDEDGNKSLAAELADLADSFVFPPCDGHPDKVMRRVQFMYTELRKRQKPGYIVRAKETIIGIMDEFNSVADSMDPSIVVVSHEGRDLNFAQTLALIEREGRKYGLHFMLIGHKWARQDIGGDNAVRTNATTYLCHKLNDQRQADLLLGGGQGKKVLELTVGSYWITGPTWNAEPARITTPAISALDLPLLLAIKKRGIQVIKEENVIEGSITELPPVGHAMESSQASGIQSIDPKMESTSSSVSEGVQPDGTGVDSIFPFDPVKLKMVRKMLMEKVTQNKIICEVWEVEVDTRAFREAKEEYLQMLAYLASLAGGKEE